MGETCTAEFFSRFADPLKYVEDKIEGAISAALISESEKRKKEIRLDLEKDLLFFAINQCSPKMNPLRAEEMLEEIINDAETKYHIDIPEVTLGYMLRGIKFVIDETPELLPKLRENLKKKYMGE